jgi:hypothetical protein
LDSTPHYTNLKKNLPGGNGRPVRKADNLTAIYEPIVALYRLTQVLHSATSQKTTFFIVTAVKASNRIYEPIV